MMNHFDVAILCGGESRRMGVRKENLKLDGTTLLERKRLQFSQAQHLYFCVGAPRSSMENSEFLFDQFLHCGPLGGIHAALSACESPLLFVAACDMPFVDWSVAQALLPYLSAEVDAVVPVLPDGRLLFVCAFFRKRCLPVLCSQLQRQNYRLQELSSLLQIAEVSTSCLPFPAGTWKNINTPADFHEIN